MDNDGAMRRRTTRMTRMLRLVMVMMQRMMMMMQRMMMMMMVMVIIPVNNCGSASVTVVGPNVQVPGFGLSILDQGPFF